MAAGYPRWAALDKTIDGWIRINKHVAEFHRNHPIQRAVVQKRYREKQKLLYGGRIDLDSVARLRWAITRG